jgi:hypothetical protein
MKLLAEQLHPARIEPWTLSVLEDDPFLALGSGVRLIFIAWLGMIPAASK